MKEEVYKASEVVFFDKVEKEFININFGCGDNLSREDMEQGYDDYVNIYVACPMEDIDETNENEWKNLVKEMFENDETFDDNEKLSDRNCVYDGGMMLFKQKDYYEIGEIDMFKEKLLKDVMEYTGVDNLDDLEVVYCK